MPNRDAFSNYHPLVNFLYFALVLCFSMFWMHPICLCISLGCALLYHLQLHGKKALKAQLRFTLPMALMAAVINPAFNHEGVTILTYLPSGNPLTLESILYGLAAAGMLAAVITWFSCYNAVMTSDKFVYLFGRIIPALSLILSMTLHFVPLLIKRMYMVSDARRAVGKDVSSGSVLYRVQQAATILSILITWALENAVETADSMKSRGYGLSGRTAFSIYRMDSRDKDLLLWLGFCGFFLCSSWMAGGFDWQYYPMLRGVSVTPMTIFVQAVYLALCLTPVILDRKEDALWKHLRSGI